MPGNQETAVTRCGDLCLDRQQALLGRYGLKLSQIADDLPIPGSFWGPPEAGLVGNCLYIRHDTPVHSMFHEAAHYICMDARRREQLHTDAGGDFAEEDAVCFLQILLAAHLPAYSTEQMMRDMDAWGYTFRLGSAADWFCHDAADAEEWLAEHGLIDAERRPTWQLNLRTR